MNSVFFDDAQEVLVKQAKDYNRTAVILQGLFDRSLVLHPHDPVRVWDPNSFVRAIELIYDDQTLTHGDKPDFEAFRRKLNLTANADSVWTGQEEYWIQVETEKENERRDNSWRDRDRGHTERYIPYGDPGPGKIAKAYAWNARSKKPATFRWRKDKRWSNVEGREKQLQVPLSEMLNVSAYKAGDYKQFYADPRTRPEYLKWAPLLLAAEDYVAGKAKLRLPLEGGDCDERS
jgi:hypothetical protein